MFTAIWAFCLDQLLGDPRSSLHPVALMGKLIAFFERILYREDDSDRSKFACGAVLVLLVLLISYAVGDFLIYLTYFLPHWAQDAAAGLILAFMICPRSLAAAGKEIYDLLKAGKLGAARQSVSMIVGRDTQQLDNAEVTRATVETIAENTVDGIISPLFFFVIGGVPLAVLYRAANTMDSMLGYKNERYLYFGRAAARLDDVLNYIPARITGFLFVFAALLIGYDAKNAMRMLRRDARKHPSPNGGFAEASMAGALHIRLGGVNSYFGRKTFRAYMGEAMQELAPKHIMAAIRMMYTAVLLFLVFAYALLVCLGH